MLRGKIKRYENIFILVTKYGHEDKVDTISVDYNTDHAACIRYCENINKLELADGWIHAEIASINKKMKMEKPYKFDFNNIKNYDDKSIQKILREVDQQQLATAIKTSPQEVKDKVFKNMSKRAVSMLQEDMEYMGVPNAVEINETRYDIVRIIQALIDTKEIRELHDDEELVQEQTNFDMLPGEFDE
jgi:hypothetical protein